MKLLGTIRKKSEIQTFENTEFKKIDLVVQDNNGTPFKIEFHNDKIEKLKDLFIGNEAVVYFNIRGNFYDKKDSKGKLTGEKEVLNTLVGFELKII